MTDPTSQYMVETFTGKFVDTKNPQADQITLDDVAHALSNTCRYGGHCQRFYSVAEHAVLVSKRLERQGYGKTMQLAGLHHDDAEAYLGDIPRPMKSLLGVAYRRLTERMDAAIIASLGLPEYDSEELHPPVKAADNWLLLVEARHLLPSKGVNWTAAQEQAWGLERPGRIVTPDYWTGGLIPDIAKQLFLARHTLLTNNIN